MLIFMKKPHTPCIYRDNRIYFSPQLASFFKTQMSRIGKSRDIESRLVGVAVEGVLRRRNGGDC